MHLWFGPTASIQLIHQLTEQNSQTTASPADDFSPPVNASSRAALTGRGAETDIDIDTEDDIFWLLILS